MLLNSTKYFAVTDARVDAAIHWYGTGLDVHIRTSY